jgi:hypothetical protein
MGWCSSFTLGKVSWTREIALSVRTCVTQNSSGTEAVGQEEIHTGRGYLAKGHAHRDVYTDQAARESRAILFARRPNKLSEATVVNVAPRDNNPFKPSFGQLARPYWKYRINEQIQDQEKKRTLATSEKDRGHGVVKSYRVTC